MANTVSQSVYRIDPLKGGENYLSWETQMSDILEDQGYWKYVNGTTPPQGYHKPNTHLTGRLERGNRKRRVVKLGSQVR